MDIKKEVEKYTETLSTALRFIESLIRCQNKLHELFLENHWDMVESHIAEMKKMGEDFDATEKQRQDHYLSLRRIAGLPPEGEGMSDLAEYFDEEDWKIIQKLHRDIRIAVSRYKLLSNCFHEFAGDQCDYQEKLLSALIPGYEDRRYEYQGSYSSRGSNLQALLCDWST